NRTRVHKAARSLRLWFSPGIAPARQFGFSDLEIKSAGGIRTAKPGVRTQLWGELGMARDPISDSSSRPACAVAAGPDASRRTVGAPATHGTIPNKMFRPRSLPTAVAPGRRSVHRRSNT